MFWVALDTITAEYPRNGRYRHS